MRIHILEVNEVLSSLFLTSNLSLLLLYSKSLLNHSRRFRSPIELTSCSAFSLSPNSFELCDLNIFIDLPLLVIPIFPKFSNSIIIVFMADLINSFRIMISLYLRLQLINYNLLFLLALHNFFLSFNRNIINIDISSLLILTSLSTFLPFTIDLFLLLRQLHLIH